MKVKAIVTSCYNGKYCRRVTVGYLAYQQCNTPLRWGPGCFPLARRIVWPSKCSTAVGSLFCNIHQLGLLLLSWGEYALVLESMNIQAEICLDTFSRPYIKVFFCLHALQLHVFPCLILKVH